ncbi:3-isopropylmalate dehydratase [Chloroflexota bacterium]
MPITNKLRGKAWIFGDLMGVDAEIYPLHIANREFREMNRPIPDELLAKYCMTGIDPDFPKKVKKGDFIVAGRNFGYGHDHYDACGAIRGAGISAVLCESSTIIFQRNSIHNAVPVIVCEGITKKTKEGDELEVDLIAGTIENVTTGDKWQFAPFPNFLMDIIEAGGLHPYIMNRQGKWD